MILALADETIYTIVIAVIGALGSAIKIYIDYKQKKDNQDRAEAAEQRSHELELEKLKSETALRASIVGIERHKRTMSPSDQMKLAETIKQAAKEESIEDALNDHVTKITKKDGTRFFDPELLNGQD